MVNSLEDAIKHVQGRNVRNSLYLEKAVRSVPYIGRNVEPEYDPVSLSSSLVYFHERTLSNPKLRGEESTNLLVLGPTGGGKSYLAKCYSVVLNKPFVVVKCGSLTRSGYHGTSVSRIIRRVLEASNGNVKRAEKAIVVLDEVGKLSQVGEAAGDVSRGAVQEELLPYLEGSEVDLEDMTFDTTNIQWWGMESFERNMRGMRQKHPDFRYRDITEEHLSEWGMIDEFIGRFGVPIPMERYTPGELMQILEGGKNSPIRVYQTILAEDNIDLTFTKAAKEHMVKMAIESGKGARGLKRVNGKLAQLCALVIATERDKYSITQKHLRNTGKYVRELRAEIGDVDESTLFLHSLYKTNIVKNNTLQTYGFKVQGRIFGQEGIYDFSFAYKPKKETILTFDSQYGPEKVECPVKLGALPLPVASSIQAKGHEIDSKLSDIIAAEARELLDVIKPETLIQGFEAEAALYVPRPPAKKKAAKRKTTKKKATKKKVTKKKPASKKTASRKTK